MVCSSMAALVTQSGEQHQARATSFRTIGPTESISYFLTFFCCDCSSVLCRDLSKTRAKVPLYLAHRSASMRLLLATYHPAPDRLSRTWQMHLWADSSPPLPRG